MERIEIAAIYRSRGLATDLWPRVSKCYGLALSVAIVLGPIAIAGAQVPVKGQPPIAAFKTIPSNPWYTDPVTFDASASSDVDGKIVSYAWNFGDGLNGMGVLVDHQFEGRGNYTVRLTVTDNDGLTNTIVVQVPVTDTSR